MADRMRVTSVIGDTGRAKVSSGQPFLNLGVGCGIFGQQIRLTW
jgi:hypothetical protein